MKESNISHDFHELENFPEDNEKNYNCNSLESYYAQR